MPAHLFFVGSSEHYTGPLKDLIDQLGIGDHVHTLDGWLSDQTYRDYLLAADFAVQLRSHRLGGLSGAVMDCISAGLPTVCNRDLGDSMEAPDFVLRVPDNFSPTLIAECLMNAFEEDLNDTRLSQQRATYLSEHSFQNYAKQFISLLGLPT
jgi:glycosyltransferase involved in cell wall biosynthesis